MKKHFILLSIATALLLSFSSSAKLYRYISMDSGGVLGINIVHLLADIEKQTQRPIHKLVDGMAGTSTGALIALMSTIATPERPLSALEIDQFYRMHASSVFEKAIASVVATFFGKRGDLGAGIELKEKAEKVFGNAKLSEALIDLTIVSYDVDADKTYLFESARAKLDVAEDFKVSDVARASSSVRFVFGEVEFDVEGQKKRFVDAGSVGNRFQVNDPTPFLIEKLKSTLSAQDEAIVYSLGTGFSKASRIENLPSNMRVIRLEPDVRHLVGPFGMDLLAADASPEMLNSMIEAAEEVKKTDGYRRMLSDLLAVSAAKDEL